MMQGKLESMAGKTGRFAMLEQFLADGMTHMFGNPGTVEQGFLDALAEYPQLSREDIQACLAYGAEAASERYIEVPVSSVP